MSIASALLAEFEAQAEVTRRFLERLPEDRLTWKPHDRSMTAGQLALHLAIVPGSVARAVAQLKQQAPDFTFPQPAEREEILLTLEESIATVRKELSKYDDAAMNETWRLYSGEKEIFAVPRQQFLRDIMLNHWYQHRGQFSVYLRLMGQAVPSSWGPSADESPIFPQQREMAAA